MDVLLPVPTTLINRSLREGCFPTCYKEAVVRPLIKKPSADPEECTSFRPVSNLAFVSKILEKVVASQLKWHLCENDLEETLQSAYRQNHSCETALLKVHNDITRAVADNKVVALVLLDMSAAFDTVDHTKMLSILHQLGICSTALDWIASYLADRQQRVLIGDSRSDPQPLNCGVPQGSVLGPLLFTIYTSSLSKIIRQHLQGFHFYADDIQLYVEATPDELPSAIHTLETCIVSVRSWLCSHQLMLNSSKTEFMLISSKRISHNLNDIHLHVGEHSIHSVERVKNLGVTMDHHATMKQHVSSVCRAAFAQLRAINRIKRCLDFQSLEIIMHAFVSFRLDYCNSVLAGINQHLITRLQRVQNAAARVLTGTPKRDHISPVLHSLHWLPIPARIQYKIAIMVFKCIHGTAPQYLQELLQLYAQERELRSNARTLLVIPLCHSSRTANQAFSVIGPTLWNSLPSHVQSSPSLTSFKSSLKTHLFLLHY